MMEAQAERLQIADRFDRNKRDYNDLSTQLAEMIDGKMRTPFEYSFDGQDFYAEDGSSMRGVFTKSLEEADAIAQDLPELAFEPRRRTHEMGEFHDMVAMAQGKAPNTMVVVSDFPPELMNATKDVGGYNTRRKQTMLRVLTWNGHKLKMYSQSLDQSNRTALEAIYQSLGYQPRPGELLGQRMHLQLDPSDQDLITDKLMGVYDTALQGQLGGHWHAGRPDDGSRINTYDFVLQQRDIMQHALQAKRFGSLDVYNVAALLEKRLRANQVHSPGAVVTYYHDPFRDLNRELLEAGMQAKVLGKVFSACGLSVDGERTDAEGQMEQAGYGNKVGHDEHGPLVFKCKFGHFNRREPGELKTECRVVTCPKDSVGC